MKIGDEVYVHGYVDEIRKDYVIIRNDGGYFGTVAEEVLLSGIERVADTPQTEERCEKCVHFMTNDMGKIWCIGKKTCEKFESRSDTPQKEGSE